MSDEKKESSLAYHIKMAKKSLDSLPDWVKSDGSNEADDCLIDKLVSDKLASATTKEQALLVNQQMASTKGIARLQRKLKKAEKKIAELKAEIEGLKQEGGG